MGAIKEDIVKKEGVKEVIAWLGTLAGLHVLGRLLKDPVKPWQFQFDVSQKDSGLDEEFKVTEYRNYIFALQFEYKDREDKDRVRKLVGDGAYKVYTRESADTSHPVLVISKTKEEVQLYHQRISSGEYVTRPTDRSGAVPIHIRVLKKEQEEPPLADETVETLGYFTQGFNPSGTGGYFERMITVLALKPGWYRIQARTTQEKERFKDVTTKLAITFHANAVTLEEQDKELQYAMGDH